MKRDPGIYLTVLILGLASTFLVSGCQPQPPKVRRLPHDYVKYKLSRYDSLEYFNISPDGSRFMALYKVEDRWYAQVNERVFEDFQGTLLDSFPSKPRYCFSPDSSKVAVVYKKERTLILRAAYQANNQKIPGSDTLPQWFVRMNSNIYGGFDGDHMPEVKFSPDGSVFGFAYKNRGLYYVRLNEEVLGPYQKADMTFTPEGRIALAIVESGFAYLNEMEMTPLNK